jgi:hypothetical protein
MANEVEITIIGQKVKIKGLPDDCNITILLPETGLGYHSETDEIFHIGVPLNYFDEDMKD